MDNYLLKSHGNNNLLIGDFNDQFINDIYDNINDLDYVDNEQEIINQHDYASNFKDNSNNELNNKHCHQNINVNDIQDAKNNVKIHQNNVKNIKSVQGNNPEENIKIEDFTILKELLNKQNKQREQEQILLFVAIIGVCIILLINNKH